MRQDVDAGVVKTVMDDTVGVVKAARDDRVAFVKVIGNILSWVVTISAAAVLAIIVLSAVCNVRPYVVMSGSMEPAVPTGSLVWIDQNRHDADVGDVIAYRLGDIIVTHRVVGFDDAGNLITKGDANATADSVPVPRDRIVGKYLLHLPGAGYAVAAIQKTTR